MLRIALCDDDKEFLNDFINEITCACKAVLSEDIDYSIVPGFLNGEKLIEYAESNHIDLLFLDIDMPKLTGFEIAKVFSEKHEDTLIVFMSSYDNFVYDVFEYSPFAYLRKKDLKNDLSKIVKRLLDKVTAPIRQVTLSSKNGVVALMVDDILYIESSRNYYTVHCLEGKTYECRGTMSQVEYVVKPFDFFRVHSAFLVNLNNVERIMDNATVLVKDNIMIPVAQRRMADFKKEYMAFTRRCLNF